MEKGDSSALRGKGVGGRRGNRDQVLLRTPLHGGLIQGGLVCLHLGTCDKVPLPQLGIKGTSL